MKILVIGHAQHGKDTFCKLLEEFGYTWKSSSDAAAEVVFNEIGSLYEYASPAEAHADRDNHRDEWGDIMAEYNTPDAARLAKEILYGVCAGGECAIEPIIGNTLMLSPPHDIYCGMRRRREFRAARKLFDLVIWVDASNRKPLEPKSSMELVKEDADIIIDNNCAELVFMDRVRGLAACLRTLGH